MITKGIVQATKLSNNKLLVRIPIFEAASSNNFDSTKAIFECPISQSAGIYGGFLEGDIVYVAFENSTYSNPVVIGKLYTEKDKKIFSSLHQSKVLEVSDKVKLPIDTTIGNLSYSELLAAVKKVELINNSNSGGGGEASTSFTIIDITSWNGIVPEEYRDSNILLNCFIRVDEYIYRLSYNSKGSNTYYFENIDELTYRYIIINANGDWEISYEDEISIASQQYVTEELAKKQDILVSGANIKTINNQSILGAGNLTISGGSGGGTVIVESDTDGEIVLSDSGTGAFSVQSDTDGDVILG